MEIISVYKLKLIWGVPCAHVRLFDPKNHVLPLRESIVSRLCKFKPGFNDEALKSFTPSVANLSNAESYLGSIGIFVRQPQFLLPWFGITTLDVLKFL